MLEKVEVVSHQTGQPIGVQLTRAEIIEQKAWCRSTNVFVLNTQGEVLCHQRSFNKERLPGVWFTHFGGHVGVDEKPNVNALKELEEEANIITDANQLIHWSTFPVEKTSRVKDVRLWMHNFVALFQGDASVIKPQEGEVEQFKWHSIEEILASEQQNPHMWNAGIHNFHLEYCCLRSALTVAHTSKLIQVPDQLHVWQSVLA